MSASDNFHHAHLGEGKLLLENDSASATLPNAMQNRLEDWLALELTAERMAQDELLLVTNYVVSDVRNFTSDITGSLNTWDSPTLNFLLQAADPSKVDWEVNHWWGPASPTI